MARNALVLSLLATIVGCASATDEESTGSGDSAINAGQQDGAPSEIPESVLIAVGTKDYCTGVLIAPTLVLTATHCSGNSYSVTAPFALGGKATSKARIAGVVAHSNDFNSEIEKEDVAVLKLDTPIRLAVYPEIRDVGELHGQRLRGVAVGRTKSSRTADLVKSIPLTVTSGTDAGYTTGVSTEYYSSGGDSGGPLFLMDDKGRIQHVVIGIERQPEPEVEADHFTRITAKVKALVAASR